MLPVSLNVRLAGQPESWQLTTNRSSETQVEFAVPLATAKVVLFGAGSRSDKTRSLACQRTETHRQSNGLGCLACLGLHGAGLWICGQVHIGPGRTPRLASSRVSRRTAARAPFSGQNGVPREVTMGDTSGVGGRFDDSMPCNQPPHFSLAAAVLCFPLVNLPGRAGGRAVRREEGRDVVSFQNNSQRRVEMKDVVMWFQIVAMEKTEFDAVLRRGRDVSGHWQCSESSVWQERWWKRQAT